MLAEVDIAGQFAADKDVEAVTDDLRLDRAGIRQRLVHLRRAQVDKQAQRGAQAEQRLLRTLFTRNLVPLRTADRAEQHRICILTDLEIEAVAELFADLIEHEHSLGDDLRTDAVAFYYCDIIIHEIMPLSP